MQADMKVAPHSADSFLQDMNFAKGDDKFISSRASLLNKISLQYIHYAVVKGDDHEASSTALVLNKTVLFDYHNDRAEA